nr:MAG TPA: hypothetical protein [Caudoviricetes sp.]
MKFAVEIKIDKNYYNEPDYDFWDSDAYPEVEANNVQAAIEMAIDNYQDSMISDDTVEDIDIDYENDIIYYTENGIPCRVMFSAIEREKVV